MYIIFIFIIIELNHLQKFYLGNLQEIYTFNLKKKRTSGVTSIQV